MIAKMIEEKIVGERTVPFRDRLHAGQLLAEKMREYAGSGNAIILAPPAGGVPVGYPVAKEIGVPLDVVMVRKVQVPCNTEAGIGALTSDGETVLNEHPVRGLGLTK